MKITISLASFLLLLVTAFTSHASFEDAVKHYEKGNYEQALIEFQSLAEIGHKGSQFNLGIMYLEGTGTKQDLVKAFGWIKLSDAGKAAEEELINEIAQYFDAEKQREADFFFNSLHQAYSKEALKIALEPIYTPVKERKKVSKSSNIKPINQKAPAYPREAAYQGVEGWVLVSFHLSDTGYPMDISVQESFPGKMFVKNSLKAIERWQFEIPDNYDTNKQYKYRLEYMLSGGSNSYVRALKKIKKKAEEGDAESQYYYAKFGPEVLPKEEINPTVWYYKAAQQGIANAQYELANNLLEGEGCEEDKEKAIAWLIKSASGNLGRSHFKLSKLFFKLEDHERAYFWLDKAIAAKDMEIAFELAKFIDSLNSNQYQLDVVLNLLKQAESNVTVSPIRFYEYYADVAARLGDYELASEYQFKANMAMKRIANVPLPMREKLDQYQAKRTNSDS